MAAKTPVSCIRMIWP